ncbi:MAG: CapA family protein [Clostridium sp.]|nr:CapA family protein [Clostridium sp.]
MKKVSKGNNKNSKNNKSVGRGMLFTFLMTFCLVLATGLAALIAYVVLNRQSVETSGPAAAQAEASPEKEQEDIQLFQEKIPESTAKPENTESKESGEEEIPEPNLRYGDVLADEEYMKANRILARQAASEEEITFCFAGDFLLDDEYAIMVNLLSRGGRIEDGVSEALLENMRGADVMVINNEFPYTNRGTATEDKKFTFRADTDTVHYLHDIGADVAILANNHIYDFGEIGLLDTLETLEGAEIPGVGAGRNIEEASAPLYFIINDMKIAIVAATQIERLEYPDTRGATAESPGVFRCLDPARLYKTVAEAKENSDFVIVYIHWGTENVAEPDWLQLEQAPGLAEAGADLIIGDHPHCLQGIDYFGDTPVIYSLGNFFFNSRTMDSCLVRVTIGQEGLKSFQFLPAVQTNSRVDLAYGEEKTRILDYMRELSPNVVIDGEGFVSKQ